MAVLSNHAGKISVRLEGEQNAGTDQVPGSEGSARLQEDIRTVLVESWEGKRRRRRGVRFRNIFAPKGLWVQFGTWYGPKDALMMCNIDRGAQKGMNGRRGEPKKASGK